MAPGAAAPRRRPLGAHHRHEGVVGGRRALEAGAGLRELLPDQQPRLVAGVVEVGGLHESAAPDPEQPGAGVGGEPDQVPDPVLRDVAVHRVDGRPVPAHERDRLAVDLGRVGQRPVGSAGVRHHPDRPEAGARRPVCGGDVRVAQGDRVERLVAVPARPPPPRAGHVELHRDAAGACAPTPRRPRRRRSRRPCRSARRRRTSSRPGAPRRGPSRARPRRRPRARRRAGAAARCAAGPGARCPGAEVAGRSPSRSSSAARGPGRPRCDRPAAPRPAPDRRRRPAGGSRVDATARSRPLSADGTARRPDRPRRRRRTRGRRGRSRRARARPARRHRGRGRRGHAAAPSAGRRSTRRSGCCARRRGPAARRPAPAPPPPTRARRPGASRVRPAAAAAASATLFPACGSGASTYHRQVCPSASRTVQPLCSSVTAGRVTPSTPWWRCRR